MINEPNVVGEKDVRQLYHGCHTKVGLSWGAIIIGGLIGFGLGFLLNIFGFAIGLTSFKPTTNGLLTLAFGGFLGMLVGAIITMFVSGWAAGFYARSYSVHPHYGVVYGFAAWCIAIIISGFMAGHIGHLMSSQNFMANQNSAVMTNVHTQTMQAVAQEGNINPPATVQTAQRNTEMAAHNLGISMFMTFIVLFMGALSSCFGGYFGMRYRIKKGCSCGNCHICDKNTVKVG